MFQATVAAEQTRIAKQMIGKKTVVILGAGASMPYGFPSGQQLLRSAQAYTGPDGLADYVRPAARAGVPPLFNALQGTLDQSIDAMLETLPTSVVDVGKAFIARSLLTWEFRARTHPSRNDGQWLPFLWDALDLRSLSAFRATPIQFVTYNYDRYLERALYTAITVKFPGASAAQYREALDSIGPIHLHGQLGLLPELSDPTAPDRVPFGGTGPDGPTDTDCLNASQAIQIVHEPTPTDDAFVRARAAIAWAERVIFLGFGYAKNNIQRLQLSTCLNTYAEVFLCVTGFSEQQQGMLLRPLFREWPGVAMGREDYDIVQFLRHYPHALL